MCSIVSSDSICFSDTDTQTFGVGFSSLVVCFIWGTCSTHFQGEIEESDEAEEIGNGNSSKRQAKLNRIGQSGSLHAEKRIDRIKQM
ncbi:hypothetical protein YC2023_020383 [Brassica napus]